MVDAKLTINIFDLVVISLLFLSALLSMYRGFIREALSLATWIGAAMVTLYAVEPVAKMLLPYVNEKQFAATVVAALGTFFVTLLTFSILSSLFARYVRDAGEVGTIDHFLGMFFGIAKGSLVVILGFVLFSQVVGEDDYPEWLRTAASRPYVEKGAKLVVAAMPQYLGQSTKHFEEAPAGKDLDPNAILPEGGSATASEGNQGYNADTEAEFLRILRAAPAAGPGAGQ